MTGNARDEDRQLDAADKEGARLRKAGWRLMVQGLDMIRQADALDDAKTGTQSFEMLECAECAGLFPLWRRERDWYERRRSGRPWSPPRRCADCRGVRRATHPRKPERSE